LISTTNFFLPLLRFKNPISCFPYILTNRDEIEQKEC